MLEEVLKINKLRDDWEKKNNFRTPEKSCFNCKYLGYDEYTHSYFCNKMNKDNVYSDLGMVETTVQATICDKYKNER